MKGLHRGATIIEFALVLLVLLMFVLGIVDFARMMFTWSAASEATRAGARYAVVCTTPSTGDGAVLTRMQAYLPAIQSISVAWEPAGPPACDASSCERVRVSINSLQFQWLAPIPGLSKLAARAMPRFDTVLPRESMRQDTHSASLCN